MLFREVPILVIDSQMKICLNLSRFLLKVMDVEAKELQGCGENLLESMSTIYFYHSFYILIKYFLSFIPYMK
jgi:hypothetical protein